VIYVYGICDPAITAPTLRRRGLGGARLRALERGGLAAVYSRHRSLRPRPTPQLVLHHEHVVEAIMENGAVLPLRFGTQLEHEKQLADLLAARRDELLRSLQRVRGKAELGVRLIPQRPPPGTRAVPATGREYLLARVRTHRRYEQAVREVHDALVALSEDSRIRPPREPSTAFVAAYLIDAARTDEFRRRAHQLAERQPGMQVVVTGPWPPYNFATEQR
jgi:Gas vesicle synthesis protein GvpL/GvpF